MLRKLEGGQHFRGDGGFHRRHRTLAEGHISYSSRPLEVSDSRPVSRQPAQLLHQGTYPAPESSHYTGGCLLYQFEFLFLSSQACSTLEIGKVTEKGLIKGHAYAITNTDKASMTQTHCSTELLPLLIVALSSICCFVCSLFLQWSVSPQRPLYNLKPFHVIFIII